MLPTSSSTTCPRCGHNSEGVMKQGLTYNSKPSTIASDNMIPALWIRQEHIPRMEAEVERLNVLIRSLNQERADLLRKINSVRGTTRRLPPEILSIIFQLIRPPIDFSSRQTLTEFPDDITLRRDTYDQAEDLQLTLGAVSYQWRQYIWSTPQLWTTISVEVYEPVAENNTAILDLYFQNAQALPMTIELDMRAQLYMLRDSEDPEKRRRVFSRLESIRNTVFTNNAHKIRKLILLGLPLEWSTCVGPNLNSCWDLALAWPLSYTQEADYNLTGLSQLPNLRCIDFTHLSAPVAIPSSVTVITVNNMSSSQCFVLLTTCLNLLEFRLSSWASDSSSEIPTGLDARIVVPRLRRLDWHLWREPWNIAFLRHVRFSQLRSLQLSGSFGISEEENRDALVSFLSELPLTLQSVDFNEFSDFGQRVMIDIITNLPSTLTSLGFVGCADTAVTKTMRMMGRSIAAFQAPHMTDFHVRDGVVSGAEGPLKVLPSLHTLKVFNKGMGDRHFEHLFELLGIFHSVTRDWRRVPFKLVLLRVLGHEESDEKNKKRATELVEAGFDLEVIWESSHGSRSLVNL